MKRVIFATLALGLGAGSAGAQLNLRGSDTLFDFTQNLLTICDTDPVTAGVQTIPASVLVYKGGGSGLGESEMIANRQEIAPMSRFLNANACSATGGQSGVLNDGQACKVALDGIGIFTDNNEPNTCSTIRFSGSMTVLDQNGVAGLDDGAGGAVASTYTFSDWRDALRIVYAGQAGSKAATSACNDGFPSRSLIADKKCNSDIRHTLVNNWNNLFEGGGACNGADPDACTALKHAFRRDDVSGTTDVFLEALALPAITAAGGPFCNGVEQQDEDPIRRDCSESGSTAGDEQVCNTVALSLLGPDNTGNSAGWRGGPTVNPADADSADVGLVLAMVIPPGTPYNDITSCAAAGFGGSFRFAPMPSGFSAAQQRCPDGNGRIGGQCQTPAKSDGAGGFVFGCVNPKLNRPGARSIANMDGRVYNLIPRNADATMQTVPRVQSGVEVAVPVHHAMYRIHETRVMPGGSTPVGLTGCREPDATNQIGCLVAASPCTVGFAGLTADQQGNNKPLKLRQAAVVCDQDGTDNNGDTVIDEVGELCEGILPSPLAVQRLNDPFGPGCETAGNYEARYPLSRNLWFSAIDGFEGTDGIARNFDAISNTNQERDLVKCACDRFYADQATTAAGFVKLSVLTAGQCTAAGQGGVCDSFIRTCP